MTDPAAGLIYDDNSYLIGASVFMASPYPAEFSIEEAKSEDWSKVKTELLLKVTERYSIALESARELALKADRGEDVTNE